MPKALILRAQPVNFEPEPGKKIEMCKLHMVAKGGVGQNAGLPIQEVNGPLALFEQLKGHVPCLVDAQYDIGGDSFKGKTIVSGFKFIEKVVIAGVTSKAVVSLND